MQDVLIRKEGLQLSIFYKCLNDGSISTKESEITLQNVIFPVLKMMKYIMIMKFSQNNSDN